MEVAVPSLLYLIPVYIVFHLVRRDLRSLVLLLAGILYVYLLSPIAAAAVLAAGICTYVVGLLLGYLVNRRAALAGSSVHESHTGDGPLKAVQTEVGAHTDAAEGSLSQNAGAKASSGLLVRCVLTAGILAVVAVLLGVKYGSLPVLIGSSYYGFQIISYFVDITTGKIQAEKNPISLLLYLLWFPRFISGPIDRPGQFLSQIEGLKAVTFYE